MTHSYRSDVRLDTSDAGRPQLLVAVPLDQTDVVRDALAKLANNASPAASVQEVLLGALRTAAEQTYFWSPEWQEKERSADLAIAESRFQTYDQIDEMIEFLDQQ